jgi:chromatin segregation and condensation protein Rec8/ScpA/Scc1 (kleisin family)
MRQRCPDTDRAALASTVVAALELARNGAVKLEQDHPFGRVMLALQLPYLLSQQRADACA